MNALDSYLEWSADACSSELERLFAPHALDAHGQLYDLVLDYPRRGGKAIRPALAIASCMGHGGRLEEIIPTAATLELYHNAFLIHDDIEDGSLLRRNLPAMHIEHGIPLAINVGDAMLSLALQPLLENVGRIGLGPALRILQTISDMTRITVEGQAIELEWVRKNVWELCDHHYLAMVERKTSWYSFIVPLQVGAIAAGAPASVLSQFEHLGRCLGAAFQITDDLLNLRAAPEDYGKEIGGDLWEGKRTLILLHAVGAAPERERARAIEILGRNRPSGQTSHDLSTMFDQLEDAGELTAAGRSRISRQLGTQEQKRQSDVQWLYELVRSTGALEHARSVAADLATEASASLATIDSLPPSQHRHLLESLVEFVVDRSR